ncbi:hypothetical protein NC652_004426 [Populus alba x Populus x berolinensis]|nr:hypothetical protein NC652_004426 [Populus alba x Populus x berolinensis]
MTFDPTTTLFPTIPPENFTKLQFLPTPPMSTLSPSSKNDSPVLFPLLLRTTKRWNAVFRASFVVMASCCKAKMFPS